MTTHYIYLVQLREFIKTKENVYKLGRTKKEHYIRFNQYPKGSVLLFQMICNECISLENCIIKKFKEKFIHRKEFGREFFEGDYKLMIDELYLNIKNEKICANDDFISKESSEVDKNEKSISIDDIPKKRQFNIRKPLDMKSYYLSKKEDNMKNEKTPIHTDIPKIYHFNISKPLDMKSYYLSKKEDSMKNEKTPIHTDDIPKKRHFNISKPLDMKSYYLSKKEDSMKNDLLYSCKDENEKICIDCELKQKFDRECSQKKIQSSIQEVEFQLFKTFFIKYYSINVNSSVRQSHFHLDARQNCNQDKHNWPPERIKKMLAILLNQPINFCGNYKGYPTYKGIYRIVTPCPFQSVETKKPSCFCAEK
jgi:hypothetical protein